LESRIGPTKDGAFQGRLVAVTGGARGLGRALVEAFADQGAHVAFSYHRGISEAHETERRLVARGTPVFTQPADALRPGEMERFIGRAAGALGGLDVLVNNAGVFPRTPLGEVSETQLDEAFAVNVKAAVLATQAAAPHLRRRRGTVVNVASLGGVRPWPAHVAYCATKAGLVMATRCLALALAPDVRVNAVAPGVLDPAGADEAVRGRIPLRRYGHYDEAVAAVLFLAGAATYTTGEVLSVDGGRALR
jgi:pteridine reductase